MDGVPILETPHRTSLFSKLSVFLLPPGLSSCVTCPIPHCVADCQGLFSQTPSLGGPVLSTVQDSEGLSPGRYRRPRLC